MEKTILGYILGFVFSFVTIFEGMYVLSKFYPELFRPIPKSNYVLAVVDSVKLKDDSLGVMWEDTSSIGLEYVEAYKLDSLKSLYNETVAELKRYKDSVVVLNKIINGLKAEVRERDLIVEKLQRQILNQQDDKIKAMAKIYESMEPEAAARILENMPESEALQIILNMQRRQAAKILSEISATKASKLSKLK
ncbi:MAG: MotE family protein [Candidatus Kryptonium sp.]